MADAGHAGAGSHGGYDTVNNISYCRGEAAASDFSHGGIRAHAGTRENLKMEILRMANLRMALR